VVVTLPPVLSMCTRAAEAARNIHCIVHIHTAVGYREKAALNVALVVTPPEALVIVTRPNGAVTPLRR
jgi:hypothetical protein